MPKDGFTGVTLQNGLIADIDAALADRSLGFSTPTGGGRAELIREAVHEYLKRLPGRSPPSSPVRPSPIPSRPAPEPEPEDLVITPPAAAAPTAAPVPVPSSVAVGERAATDEARGRPPASPPPAPVEHPSPGPSPEPTASSLPAGEPAVERPVEPSAGARRSGRSSRSPAGPDAGAPAPGSPAPATGAASAKAAGASSPSTAKGSAAPAAEAPAAAKIPTGSTWTCPGCGETMPLIDRAWHGPDCPGRKSTPRPVAAEPAPRSVPTAPKETIVITRLEARVREESFRRLVRNQDQDPIGLLAVVVQQAYVDSGFPEPSDQIAEDLVKAFRFKSEPLDAALDRLEDSLSVVPRTKKGATAKE